MSGTYKSCCGGVSSFLHKKSGINIMGGSQKTHLRVILKIYTGRTFNLLSMNMAA